ncbi:DUF2625 family protein [Pasteurella atlantica]|uniref:DUF2625 family protein n=2 Tax=Pasteurellaceae TaxID=712 RepID=A0ACC6HMS7_9PAST|nr:DUF2625 family protein [Pasteurella atlantica]MDP8052134.1 DUF2625 family protein [Pasteurella atlantica]MDP8105243.1 DUF2625 family protein [Pasteurella atlantica]MDP8149036.1 DUF2625 family protein [Pasteurella atlantica]
MQDLEQLINVPKPAWDILETWFTQTRNSVEILEKDDERAAQELLTLQLNIGTPLGAVIFETGGILVKNGWLRLLGSGSKKMDRGLTEWNYGKTFAESGEKPSYLLVADDVIGGYFALNSGGLSGGLGKIHYYSPATEQWKDLNLGYSEFLGWALNADLDSFYKGLFWDNWQQQVSELSGNQVLIFTPELSVKTDNQRHSQVVPIERHYQATFKTDDKFGGAYSVS